MNRKAQLYKSFKFKELKESSKEAEQAPDSPKQSFCWSDSDDEDSNMKFKDTPTPAPGQITSSLPNGGSLISNFLEEWKKSGTEN